MDSSNKKDSTGFIYDNKNWQVKGKFRWAVSRSDSTRIDTSMRKTDGNIIYTIYNK